MSYMNPYKIATQEKALCVSWFR